MIIFDDICTKKLEGGTGNECEGLLQGEESGDGPRDGRTEEGGEALLFA